MRLLKSKKLKYAYVSVAGLLGSGKTTASNLLAEQLGFHLFEEKVNENKFLPLFYAEPKRWAFHSQLFYLREKSSQLVKIKNIINETNVIQDSPIHQDYLTYAKAQQKLGHMNEDEFALYEKMFNVLNRDVPTPNLIIQLNASVPTIMERIKKRARSYEKSIDPSYVELLSELQNEWLSNNPKINIISINTDDLNIATNPKHQEEFIEKVKKHLGNMAEEPRLRLPFFSNKKTTSLNSSS